MPGVPGGFGPPLRALRRVTGPKPQPMDPAKAVMAAPRMRPISTRNYGKGGSPMSGAPDEGIRGGGIGYGGYDPNVPR
jgi:hypothetical protein